MEEKKVIMPTSVHIREDLLEKANRVANARGISRNRLINLLIEGMEEIAVPPVSTTLPAMEVTNGN